MNLRLLTHHTAPLLLAAWMPLAAWANPSWLTADGRPLPAAHEAVRWLNEAAADGLEPADYGAQHLSDALAAAAARGLDAASAVALDQELTQAVERYLY
ncbi:murein L,D-transpeptidase, partial [Diaphorobacter sp. DS2]